MPRGSRKSRRGQSKTVEGRHIVYKVTYILDGRYYIGVRKTDVEFDGYLGSGIHIKRMVAKYGRKNFKRETLFEFTNSGEAYAKEKEILLSALSDPLCVNIAKGGQGGNTHKFTMKLSESRQKVVDNLSDILSMRKTGVPWLHIGKKLSMNPDFIYAAITKRPPWIQPYLAEASM